MTVDCSRPRDDRWCGWTAAGAFSPTLVDGRRPSLTHRTNTRRAKSHHATTADGLGRRQRETQVIGSVIGRQVDIIPWRSEGMTRRSVSAAHNVRLARRFGSMFLTNKADIKYSIRQTIKDKSYAFM